MLVDHCDLALGREGRQVDEGLHGQAEDEGLQGGRQVGCVTVGEVAELLRLGDQVAESVAAVRVPAGVVGVPRAERHGNTTARTTTKRSGLCWRATKGLAPT